MQVLKFGGSSVANADNIFRVISIVSDSVKKDRTVLVASAIGGCTDALIEIGKAAAVQNNYYTKLIDELESRHIKIIYELIPIDFRPSIELKVKNIFNQLREVCKGVYYLKELSSYSLDLIMSFGEILSTRIISDKFTSMGTNNIWTDARDIIKTDLHGTQNVVDTEKTFSGIRKTLSSNRSRLNIIPGFISSDSLRRTTTLGRGGSDYTAALIAAASDARILQIWSDVNGMMTADPKIVPDAKTIEHISYKEAQELSHFGAKVIYPPTIQPVINKGIPIEVKNTFFPAEVGTYIENSPPESRGKIRGISCSNKIALLSMEGSGMVGVPGYSARLFGALANAGINIILITQASSVHTMCVAIEEGDAPKAKQASDETFAYEISLKKVDPLNIERGFSIISLVGDDMKNQSGTGGKMFRALGRAGINIRAIAQGSSEKNISIVVQENDSDEAIRVIHKEFFGESVKRINLFIAGYGNVAKELISIVDSGRNSINGGDKTEIAIVGICNSKHMIFDKSGFEPMAIARLIERGKESDIYRFCELGQDMGLNNSIFVDCTSDSIVASSYSEFFLNNFSVVTCNKIALSSSTESYKALTQAAVSQGCSFLYETTVGAALPIISTIKQMRRCGDEIESIEAILSGTLNYLFSNYEGSVSFSKLLQKAKELGYTEPDPRLDIAGTDVLRKAVILSREIGVEREPEDIECIPFISQNVLKAQGEEFFDKLEEFEDKIARMFRESNAKGERLRYVAKISKTDCKIGIESLKPEHPLYNICGRDNAVSICSRDYTSPLMIIGAGAGARQTATGVFNDILLARQ